MNCPEVSLSLNRVSSGILVPTDAYCVNPSEESALEKVGFCERIGVSKGEEEFEVGSMDVFSVSIAVGREGGRDNVVETGIGVGFDNRIASSSRSSCCFCLI
mmetsp:Transcript_10344/g.18650  ORF Transcript_10344/g.18650 Transcript_10344/m.18650 type:complete len:102 (+) Transcript_10344:2057-2362(+)